MTSKAHHVAQINLGRIAAPLDSPIMAGFMANLDAVNAVAEASPGFIWRLVAENNDADSLCPFEDKSILINMSVWKTVDDLKGFVYRSVHAAFVGRRKEWFVTMNDTFMALWWIPAGHIPTVDEAIEHLEHLRTHGLSEYTFTFVQVFPPPG